MIKTEAEENVDGYVVTVEENDQISFVSLEENVETSSAPLEENVETSSVPFEGNVETMHFSYLKTLSNELSSNVPSIQVDGDTKSLLLEDLIKESIEVENGVWKCKVCDKISKQANHAKEHAEIHIEGLSYPCVECGTALKTRVALRIHMKRKHRHAVTKKSIV